MSWDAPNWKKAARDYYAKRKASGRVLEVETSPDRLRLLRRLLNPSVSLERAYSELNNPCRFATPQVVVEAILHCVRERGVAALKEPANIERLSRCDAAAKAQIDGRIKKLIERKAIII
jgi:hypothetical protein